MTTPLSGHGSTTMQDVGHARPAATAAAGASTSSDFTPLTCSPTRHGWLRHGRFCFGSCAQRVCSVHYTRAVVVNSTFASTNRTSVKCGAACCIKSQSSEGKASGQPLCIVHIHAAILNYKLFTGPFVCLYNVYDTYHK